jgi:8-oxo-dGTP diphosphatase
VRLVGLEVAGAAIVRHGRLLAARRTRPPGLAGSWELPGGKVQAGESAADAVVREVREELGCDIAVRRRLDGRVRLEGGYELTVYVSGLVRGEPLPTEHDAIRWLGPQALFDVVWLPADVPFVEQLQRLLLVAEGSTNPTEGSTNPAERRVRRLWT